jgi:transposase
MRDQLTDYEWAAIKPTLTNKPRGVPRVNDRGVRNGIFWVLRAGAPLQPVTDSRSSPSRARIYRSKLGGTADSLSAAFWERPFWMLDSRGLTFGRPFGITISILA